MILAGATAAQASIIPIGSNLTYSLSNFPGTCTDSTCTDTVTFSSTPVNIDGGAVSVFETQTPTAGGGEWDVWHMSVNSGGALAGDINAYWNITINYQLSQAVLFDGVVDQWEVNGTPVSPLNNFGAICCASPSNPILPGEAYYNSGFSVPLPAGSENDWDQIFVSPYDFVAAGGIDPSTADEFNFALHFTPQVSVPEPGSLAIFATALSALGLLLLWRTRRRI